MLTMFFSNCCPFKLELTTATVGSCEECWKSALYSLERLLIYYNMYMLLTNAEFKG